MNSAVFFRGHDGWLLLLTAHGDGIAYLYDLDLCESLGDLVALAHRYREEGTTGSGASAPASK